MECCTQPRCHWIKNFSSGSPRKAPHPHRPVTNFLVSQKGKRKFFGSQWHWLVHDVKMFLNQNQTIKDCTFCDISRVFCLRIVWLHPLHILYIQFPLLPPDVLVLHGQHRCRTFPKWIHQAHWEGMAGADQNCLTSISMRWRFFHWKLLANSSYEVYESRDPCKFKAFHMLVDIFTAGLFAILPELLKLLTDSFFSWALWRLESSSRDCTSCLSVKMHKSSTVCSKAAGCHAWYSLSSIVCAHFPGQILGKKLPKHTQFWKDQKSEKNTSNEKQFLAPECPTDCIKSYLRRSESTQFMQLFPEFPRLKQNKLWQERRTDKSLGRFHSCIVYTWYHHDIIMIFSDSPRNDPRPWEELKSGWIAS